MLTPCRAAITPAIIEAAAEVPPNLSVYQRFSSLIPGERSPKPSVVTSAPQPCASTHVPQLEKSRRERSTCCARPCVGLGGEPAPARIDPESAVRRANGFFHPGGKPGSGWV